eukprot:1273281-Pleurochrysis_carterae.AAC.3
MQRAAETLEEVRRALTRGLKFVIHAWIRSPEAAHGHAGVEAPVAQRAPLPAVIQTRLRHSETRVSASRHRPTRVEKGLQLKAGLAWGCANPNAGNM